MPEVKDVRAKGAPLEAGAGKSASSPSLISPHLMQGATPIGQLPSGGCCLMMGKWVLGRGDLDQQTFPGEGECDFRIVHYTSRHSDGRVELWLCCHARSSLLLSFSMFVLPCPPPGPRMAPGQETEGYKSCLK